MKRAFFAIGIIVVLIGGWLAMEPLVKTILPVDIILEIPGGSGVQLKMKLIPAGTFTMGSPPKEIGRSDTEGPQHQVTISKPF